MNVFVLCAGRSGSKTFSQACNHITNYTSGHCSKSRLSWPDRLDYPPDHIEIDNSLSWFLGRLDEIYGDACFYVHLTRDRPRVAESWAKRWGTGMIRTYSHGIAQIDFPNNFNQDNATRLEVCLDYCKTVEANIKLFLKDKSKKMDFQLENAHDDFPEFWRAIGAEGDLKAALAEFNVKFNATNSDETSITEKKIGIPLIRKVGRIITRLPNFIRTV